MQSAYVIGTTNNISCGAFYQNPLRSMQASKVEENIAHCKAMVHFTKIYGRPPEVQLKTRHYCKLLEWLFQKTLVSRYLRSPPQHTSIIISAFTLEAFRTQPHSSEVKQGETVRRSDVRSLREGSPTGKAGTGCGRGTVEKVAHSIACRPYPSGSGSCKFPRLRRPEPCRRWRCFPLAFPGKGRRWTQRGRRCPVPRVRSERRGRQPGGGGRGRGRGEEWRGAVAGPLPSGALPSSPSRPGTRAQPGPGRFRGRCQLVAAPGPRPNSNGIPGGGADAARSCAEVMGKGMPEEVKRGRRARSGQLSVPPPPAPATQAPGLGDRRGAAPGATAPPEPRAQASPRVRKPGGGA